MISLIAALQKKDRGIGFNNELLFRISDDLKRFKTLTSGHPIIMGRKTFESIGSKPLPNRTNIVITRQDLTQEGIVFCHSMEEALEKARQAEGERRGEEKKMDLQQEDENSEKIYVIGGAEIYQQALPYADQLDLTIVEGDKEADTFFPEYSTFSKVVSEEIHHDEKSGLYYTTISLRRN
jgi:dihydrofolate reductase